MNRSQRAGHYLAVRLVGAGAREGGSNRRAIGARVTVSAGEESFLREVNGGNGYASASTTRLHVGLGDLEAVDAVEVRWPSGALQVIRGEDGGQLEVDRLLVIEEVVGEEGR